MSPDNKSVESPYQPHKYQYYLHQNKARYNVLVMHRRFGKTVWGVNDAIIAAANKSAEGREHAPPRYALIYPELKQGKSNAWDYLKYYTNMIPREKNESELRIDFSHNKARIQILGADKPDRIRGEYFDGVFIDEYALCPPNLYGEVVRPTLSDYGGWVVFSGTPKGRNHFHEKLKDAREEKENENEAWFTRVFPASETCHPNQIDYLPDPEELEQAKKDMTEAQYQQEYECSFNNAVQGAYFRKQMQQVVKDNRLTEVPYDGSLPVNTAWDLGSGDNMAVICYQVVGQEIHLINAIHGQGRGMPDYFDELRQLPYSYNRHLAPWDVEATEIASGRTRKEIARQHGFMFETVPRVDVEDRIEASRALLPRCYFDEDNCETLIESLQHFRKEYDDEKQTWRDKPRKDWASHFADAFGYMALGLRGPRQNRRWKDAPDTADMDFAVM